MTQPAGYAYPIAGVARPCYVATVLTIDALVIWASALAYLFVRFRREGATPFARVAAATAAATGALLLAIPGALHTIAVALSARTYDARLAWLLTVGLVLIYTGLTAVAASPGMRNVKREAFSRAAWSTSLLLALLLVLQPVMDQSVLIAVIAPLLALLVSGARRIGRNRGCVPRERRGSSSGVLAAVVLAAVVLARALDGVLVGPVGSMTRA